MEQVTLKSEVSEHNDLLNYVSNEQVTDMDDPLVVNNTGDIAIDNNFSDQHGITSESEDSIFENPPLKATSVDDTQSSVDVKGLTFAEKVNVGDESLDSPLTDTGANQTVVLEKKCSMMEEVKSLVYWKNPVKSGITFGILLITEIILMSMSFLSVVGYVGLGSLVGIFGYRSFLKVTGRSDSIGILKILDQDFKVTPESIKEKSDMIANKMQSGLDKLRDLFLLKNTANTVKFGLTLYTLTYVGARLNFLTLCLIATICAFTLPLVHDQRKEEINKVLAMALEKYQEIWDQCMSKITALWNKKKAE